MSEFDRELAQAVEAGIARGRLPGAADAVRRGRRRGLRARGGLTLLGVAAVAGALGGASALDGGAAGAGAGSSGVHADEGILPAEQWPAYAVGHWKVSPDCDAADRSKCRPGDPVDPAVTDVRVGDVLPCTPGAPIPVRRFVHFATQWDEAHKLDADEEVWTFADGDAAAAFMAQARVAAPGKGCGGMPGEETSSPGVSTADGTSWLLTGHGGVVSYGHDYLVQAGDRVARIRVSQLDADTIHSTAADPTVLSRMRQALER